MIFEFAEYGISSFVLQSAYNYSGGVLEISLHSTELLRLKSLRVLLSHSPLLETTRCKKKRHRLLFVQHTALFSANSYCQQKKHRQTLIKFGRIKPTSCNLLHQIGGKNVQNLTFL